MSQPSPNGGNGAPGRDSRGRFTRGNPGGPGNPHAARVGRLRNVLLSTVTAEDMQRVALSLLAQAEGGDVAAAKLIFNYVLGKPAAAPDSPEAELTALELARKRRELEATDALTGVVAASLFGDGQNDSDEGD